MVQEPGDPRWRTDRRYRRTVKKNNEMIRAAGNPAVSVLKKGDDRMPYNNSANPVQYCNADDYNKYNLHPWTYPCQSKQRYRPGRIRSIAKGGYKHQYRQKDGSCTNWKLLIHYFKFLANHLCVLVKFFMHRSKFIRQEAFMNHPPVSQRSVALALFKSMLF